MATDQDHRDNTATFRYPAPSQKSWTTAMWAEDSTSGGIQASRDSFPHRVSNKNKKSLPLSSFQRRPSWKDGAKLLHSCEPLLVFIPKSSAGQPPCLPIKTWLLNSNDFVRILHIDLQMIIWFIKPKIWKPSPPNALGNKVSPMQS